MRSPGFRRLPSATCGACGLQGRGEQGRGEMSRGQEGKRDDLGAHHEAAAEGGRAEIDWGLGGERVGLLPELVDLRREGGSGRLGAAAREHHDDARDRSDGPNASMPQAALHRHPLRRQARMRRSSSSSLGEVAEQHGMGGTKFLWAGLTQAIRPHEEANEGATVRWRHGGRPPQTHLSVRSPARP